MGVNCVSPNDVADAAAMVILRPHLHANKVYNLTGPGPTQDSLVTKLLSETSMHMTTADGESEPPKPAIEIECMPLRCHECVEHCKHVCKLPIWQVKDSAEFEQMKAMGFDELPFMCAKRHAEQDFHLMCFHGRFLLSSSFCLIHLRFCRIWKW